MTLEQMMTQQIFLDQIRDNCSRYLNGRISGREVVRNIDDLMEDQLPDDLPDSVLNALHSFHDDLALYVEDETERNKEAAYYGPEELSSKLRLFLETSSSM